MAKDEISILAKKIHGYLLQMADDDGIYFDDLAPELGGEEELQHALLATAVVEGLIEPSPALLPIFREIEEKLAEIVDV